MLHKSVVISLFLAFLVSNVRSFENGAGGCVGGKVAVGGPHLTQPTVVSRTLAQKGVTVSIGGVTIAPGKTGVVPYGRSLTIRVNSREMEGILIRVQAPSGVSTRGVLTPGRGLQMARACRSPVVGVTHMDDFYRSSFVSQVRFPNPTRGVIFDISIVYENDENRAEHAYGRIRVDFTQKPRL